MSDSTAKILDIGDELMLGACDDGRKVWLEGPAVPGDEVTFQFTGKTGTITRIVRPSPERVAAFCPHFDTCPGCQLQPLPYNRQLELKRSKIVETLRRLGGFSEIPFLGLEASPDHQGYRNKLDFTVEGSHVGYQSRNGLVAVTECPVSTPELNSLLPGVQKVLKENPRHQLHRLMLRINGTRDRIHILLRGLLGEQEEAAFIRWASEHDLISGLSIQEDWRSEWETLYGDSTVALTLAGQTHLIQHDGFFQINDGLADQLVSETMNWLGEKEKGSLLDLFCGVGAFTLPAQAKGYSVLGLDSQPGKGPFQKVDLRKGVPKALLNKTWQTVLTDPPRAGMDKTLCLQIRDHIRPQRLFYISCNPATLARDLKYICADQTYQIKRVKGFDLFPQTTHVETLVELARTGM